MRARDGEGAKSCGSDRFVVVSAVTSSSELGDLLLHAKTAGKQLITDIANVPLACAMKVLNLISTVEAPKRCKKLMCFLEKCDARSPQKRAAAPQAIGAAGEKKWPGRTKYCVSLPKKW